ncbi:MAG: tryptophan-rich sensory protein [Methanotrichaceae archaeon]|nr:tryptophan-rich sensory protein [Methanotrichaceae archaeon]
MTSFLFEILKFAFSILLCQSAGAIGAIFTRKSVTTWYRYLEKPAFAPGGRFIATIWIILYTLMGISLYLISRKGWSQPGVKVAVGTFMAQLSINVLWSWAFFYLRSPIAGLAVIGALWISILSTIMKFKRLSGAAALLLVPYLIWVSIAGYLNYSIWKLNRGRTGNVTGETIEA